MTNFELAEILNNVNKRKFTYTPTSTILTRELADDGELKKLVELESVAKEKSFYDEYKTAKDKLKYFKFS